LLEVIKAFPLSSRKFRQFFTSVSGDVFIAVQLKELNQFFNRPRPIQLRIVVALKHLNESPLSPLIILRLTGSDFAAPIETETDFIELLPVTLNVVGCSNGRMLACLNGVLFSGQAVSIVTHRMQHIVSLQSLISCHYVGGYIAQGVPHVQTSSRRIREHIQHIVFRFRLIFVDFVRLTLNPLLLPLLFNGAEIILHFRILKNAAKVLKI
jgi:hypothetical protein